MIRSRSRREKMSKLRSPRLVCSTTTGTSAASGSIIGNSSFIIEAALPRTGGLAPSPPYIVANRNGFKGAKRRGGKAPPRSHRLISDQSPSPGLGESIVSNLFSTPVYSRLKEQPVGNEG